MSKETIRLSSGYQMPLVGCGTSRQEKGNKSVEMALDAGYRLIDTAFAYGNEAEVGENIDRWIKKGGGKRDDIFVITKLPSIALRAEDVQLYLTKSLKNLALDYVDLYLVHVPYGRQNNLGPDEIFPKDQQNLPPMDYSSDIIAVWKAMESLVDSGLTKSIGVSNYNIKQLRKTLSVARIPPAVLQTELHVRYQQPENVEFCKQNDIVVISYASIGSPGRVKYVFGEPKFIDMLGDPVVKLVANNHNVATAQVLLKFLVQQDIVVIPKSANPERISANIKLFHWELTDTEMAALKTLDIGREGKLFIWDKNSRTRLHPEFHED